MVNFLLSLKGITKLVVYWVFPSKCYKKNFDEGCILKICNDGSVDGKWELAGYISVEHVTNLSYLTRKSCDSRCIVAT